ncbi:hypothetical protein BJ944DRAFT_170186 [Cunninghamella echinulata]|nr:hypothetical protein BJ944DRAFT_170186 [Cunninghamella echinulata]
MTVTATEEKQPIKGSIFESDSPEPSLLKVTKLDPNTDYRTQAWKNGLGTTSEIGIYPPEKDFTIDSFFWRLSTHCIQNNCYFSLFPGYDCTTIVLPNENNATFKLNHQDLTSLQFMIKRDLGKAQFYVEKIGQPVSNESGETGKRLILGVFCLVYVVDGNVRINLNDSVNDPTREIVLAGQTLCIERDEDSSPTSMMIQAADEHGNVGNDDLDANVIIIQISESKHHETSSTNTMLDSISTMTSPNFNNNNSNNNNNSKEFDAPSVRRRREGEVRERRRSSLIIYENQQQQNKLDSKSGKQDKVSSSSTIPSSTIETTSNKNNFRQDKMKRRDSLISTLLQSSLDPAQIYNPPTAALLHKDTDVPPPVVRDRLVIEDYAPFTVSTAWIKMIEQGLSEWIRLPVIICRGTEDGVVSEIDVHKLKGTVVAIPCVNVVGYLKFQREFADGRDLNRQFPGKEDGYASQVYCYQLMHKIISQFNYLIDLHTASFGRVNSYYVRADMNDSVSATLANLQQPQIVLHNSGQDGTLRSAASARGIKAITVEIGNPQLFQSQYVQWSYYGIMRILNNLDMYVATETENKDDEDISKGPSCTILCSKGFWIYTRTGGILEVYPSVNSIIRKGDTIARVKNIFGNLVDTYFAPCSGIVIGRSSNPVAMAGDRIIHLGVIKKKGEILPKEAKENY